MIYMDESAGLVEEESCEGDAELGRDDSKSALVPLVRFVELLDLLTSLGILRFFQYLFVHQWNMPVLELLVEVRDFARLVHVDFPELFHWHAEMICDLLHIRFRHKHSL